SADYVESASGWKAHASSTSKAKYRSDSRGFRRWPTRRPPGVSTTLSGASTVPLSLDVEYLPAGVRIFPRCGQPGNAQPLAGGGGGGGVPASDRRVPLDRPSPTVRQVTPPRRRGRAARSGRGC